MRSRLVVASIAIILQIHNTHFGGVVEMEGGIEGVKVVRMGVQVEEDQPLSHHGLLG